ncbi:hypothetical protein [Jeotgalibacillus salarius]|uniref:SPOR domain-containing protein n=1 Tax=Jeotgalibacillus salarius TaxID=546023 RepID=A0A4Y8LHC5_9BACL|nr:hypothetical protein [Jeotgalibacillus salarius]TFE01024.1 hypothetical protein E2626_10180 [Jeotgalibacillus salarius]
MKQEPASKNKDGTIIHFPASQDKRKTKGLILFPIFSGILCAVIFGLILNLFLEKPDQQPLLAEPVEETTLFEVPPISFWVLQAGAFSTEEAAGDFISTLPADTSHVLVKQDDMQLLWIGAAGTEEKAKALSAGHAGDVYVKKVMIDAFQLNVSEKDHEWLSATIGAMNQKLSSPSTSFTAIPVDQLEHSDLQNLHRSIENGNSETAFLQSLSAILQIEQKISE